MMNHVAKRTISILAVLMLGFGVLHGPSSLAAQETEKSNQEAALQAMEALKLLKVIPEDYFDYNVDLEKEVTRADFATAAVGLIRQKEAKSPDTYYYDVTKTHWAYDAIGTLTAEGILNGQEENLFHPDAAIEINEAYKVLLTILGYKDMAEYSGGYPTGYLSVARRIDLAPRNSGEQKITWSNMFILLYDTLKAPMAKPVSFSDTSVRYQTDEEDTLLSVYWNVYQGKGVVEGLNGMTLNGEALNSGCIQIDGRIYDTDLSAGEYLGRTTEFFYRRDKQSGKEQALWILPDSSDRVLTITANHDAAFDVTDYSLSYYNEKRNSTAKVSLNRNIRVVYNGNVIQSDISQVFNLPRYQAQLIDNGNGGYTVAVVWAYETIVIDGIGREKQTVYDKLNPTKKVELNQEQYTYFSMTVAGQGAMQFEDLQVGNVLDVYQSRDGKYLTVEVSTDKISGVVNEIRKDANSYILSVNGVEYTMPFNGQAEPQVGSGVSLYLNAAGEAAAYESEAGAQASMPAFLIDGVLKNSGFSQTIHLKLLRSDGEIAVMECADRLKLDGEVYRAGQADSAFSGLCQKGEFFPQFVMFETDADGRIRMIDTVQMTEKESAEDSLSVSVPLQSQALYMNNGTLGLQSVINNNTVIFAVPSNDNIPLAEDEDFFTVQRSGLTTNTRLNAESYKTTDRVGYEQFLVLRDYEYSYTTELPVLVESVGSAVNAQGMIVECLNGYQGATEVSLCAKEGLSFTAQDVQPGMVLRVRKDVAGDEVDSFEILFDYRDMEAYPPGSANAAYRSAGGYANDLVDGVIKIGYNDPGVVDQVMYTANIPVLLYNTTGRGEISTGSIGDIVTYRSAGANCSKLCMITRYTTPVLFVVYE